MDRSYIRLTEEQYMEMKEMKHAQLTNAVERIIPDSIRWGYGYYGCNGIEFIDGIPYAIIRTGSSCD